MKNYLKKENSVNAGPNNYLEKIIKQQQNLAKWADPFSNVASKYSHLFDHVKNLQMPSISQEALGHLSHVEEILSSSGFSKSYFVLQQQIESSLGNINSISSELNRLSHSARFSSILTNQEKLYSIQDHFHKLASSIELPSTRIESVLASAEAASRVWKVYNFIDEFTLSSISHYQSFVERQFAHLANDKDNVAERRLEITELSGDLFESINASAAIGVALEEKEELDNHQDSSQDVSTNTVYSHINQHLGFVYKSSFQGDPEQSFYKSIPTNIVNLGCLITEKVYQINRVAENCGQQPLFKPTTQTMRACALIPSVVTSNEFDFNTIIDHLYFLIYEGSGNAARLVKNIADSILMPLWKVKNLRLAARHDIDHGSSNSIKKKRRKIHDAYFSLIKQPLPIKQRDWQMAQFKIYSEINIMLQEILLALVSPPD